MMNSLGLSLHDIGGLLQSMALSAGRGAFLPGPPSTPGHMDTAKRMELAHRATSFFGLAPEAGHSLEQRTEWQDWAEAIAAQLPPAGPERLFFRTSGSTGSPASHALSSNELREEVNSLTPYFQSSSRIVSVMPIHHVFGFVFALLLPKALGVTNLHLPPLPTAKFFTELQEGDLLLAFPVFWKSLLDLWQGASSPSLPKDLHGVSSSAPCPPEVIERLLQPAPRLNRAFLVSMTEIYGATEFGAVGIRRNCREPYELLHHWQRCTLVETQEHETPTWGIQRPGSPDQPLPDETGWQDERHFIPRKRKDFAVQVGGINVFPAEVAELLRSHPMIEDCAVRLMRPEEGHRLKAFIIPAQRSVLAEQREFIREIKHWCAGRLEPAASPKHIRLGNALPLTAAGKLADWDIAE